MATDYPSDEQLETAMEQGKTLAGPPKHRVEVQIRSEGDMQGFVFVEDSAEDAKLIVAGIVAFLEGELAERTS